MMEEFIGHDLRGERLFLLPERAIWWPSHKILIVADVHLGKATHFNKAGQALPNNRSVRDLRFLALLTGELQVERLIILGDLFHSDPNTELSLLKEFCDHIKPVQVELVAGNHDRYTKNLVKEAGIHLLDDPYCIEPFCFTHDASVLEHQHEFYILSGHVHPGIRLYGKGRQSLRLPCYYFGTTYGLLPAFGSLTGLYSICPEDPEDVVFGIAGEKVVRIPVPVKT